MPSTRFLAHAVTLGVWNGSLAHRCPKADEQERAHQGQEDDDGRITIIRTAVIMPHSPVRLAKQQPTICAARYPPPIIAATTIRNLSEAFMPSFSRRITGTRC
jgi:hypothetical protein